MSFLDERRDFETEMEMLLLGLKFKSAFVEDGNELFRKLIRTLERETIPHVNTMKLFAGLYALPLNGESRTRLIEMETNISCILVSFSFNEDALKYFFTLLYSSLKKDEKTGELRLACLTRYAEESERRGEGELPSKTSGQNTTEGEVDIVVDTRDDDHQNQNRNQNEGESVKCQEEHPKLSPVTRVDSNIQKETRKPRKIRRDGRRRRRRMINGSTSNDDQTSARNHIQVSSWKGRLRTKGKKVGKKTQHCDNETKKNKKTKMSREREFALIQERAREEAREQCAD